jgi:GTPase SAR1 family protein
VPVSLLDSKTFPDLQYFLLVGNEDAGKSSIFYKFCGHDKPSKNKIYSGCSKRIYTPKAHLLIGDLSGQERYSDLLPHYYSAAKGIAIVLDLTDPDSLYSIQKFYKQIARSCVILPAIVIVGAKCKATNRVVTAEQIAAYLAKYQIDPKNYIETDAKENINIDNIFLRLAECAREMQPLPHCIVKKLEDASMMLDGASIKKKYKVLVLGDESVGKFSLVSRYVDSTYIEDQQALLHRGSDRLWVKQDKIQYKESGVIANNTSHVDVNVTLYIRVKTDSSVVADADYAYASGLVIVYDTNDALWLEKIKARLTAAASYYSGIHSPARPHIILVRSKCDLANELSTKEVEDKITAAELGVATQFIFNTISYDNCYDVSAKTGFNVEKVFHESVKRIAERHDRREKDEAKNRASAPANRQEKPTIVQPALPDKQSLTADLKAYILKIRTGKNKPDNKHKYGYGFNVIFKDMQAANRKANYHLAKKLVKELEAGEKSVAAVFADVKGKRKTTGKGKAIFAPFFSLFTNHGIRSEDLNKVIEKARSLSVRIK